jgi:AcrR family transcriptional regulator
MGKGNNRRRGDWEPPTERGRQSRRRVLEAAERVFGEKGYFPTSITDITREAGVAQGTFYVHFQSKLHVFIELLDALTDIVIETSHAAVATAKNRLEKEELGLAAYFRFVNEHPNWYRIIRQAEFVDVAAFRKYYSRIASGYQRGLHGAIARGEISPSDPETLAFCLLGVADLVGMRWPCWTGQPIPRDVFDAMMRFIRHGLDPLPQHVDDHGTSVRGGSPADVPLRDSRGQAPIR